MFAEAILVINDSFPFTLPLRFFLLSLFDLLVPAVIGGPCPFHLFLFLMNFSRQFSLGLLIVFLLSFCV